MQGSGKKAGRAPFTEALHTLAAPHLARQVEDGLLPAGDLRGEQVALQLGVDHPRVQRVHRGFRAQLPRKLVREQDIGQLGLACKAHSSGVWGCEKMFLC